MIPDNNFLQLTLDNPDCYPVTQFKLANGTQVEIWDSGVICFQPIQASCKDIVLSCAVHGNETAPIEICNELITQLLAEQLKVVHRTLFIIANPAAILVEKRFVDENMNRLFSGEHAKGKITNLERQRAAKLEVYVGKFFYMGGRVQSAVKGTIQRIHYDLHTAIRESKNEKFAVYPYLENRQYNPQQLAFLASCGVNTVLLNDQPTTTFSFFSSHHFNADAFTIELGRVRPFGENDMNRFKQTIGQLTRLLTKTELDLAEFDESKMDIFQVYKTVNRTVEEFALGFDNQVKNFQDFPLGFVLAIDGNTEHRVDIEGEAVVFPNASVAIGQRALLTVVPTKLPQTCLLNVNSL